VATPEHAPEYAPEYPEEILDFDEELQKIIDEAPVWAAVADSARAEPVEAIGMHDPVLPFGAHGDVADDEWFDDQLAALEAAFYAGPFPEDPGEPSEVSTGPVDPAGVLATDSRTMDQLRADILTDLLLASDASTLTQIGLESVRATVQVSIAAETLVGADERLAEHDSHGPTLPDIVRILAGNAPSWTRLFIDPAGLITETDVYTPTAAMKRHLRARDQHCRFPGCRAPAERCQIDHNYDHAKGGRTALSNLCLLCTGHHPIKHPDLADQDRWEARQLGDGTIEWVSPLGRSYTDHPTRRVLFT
jgi:hypothetical protein